MDSLSSISLAAANSASQSYGTLGALTAIAGQDPTAGTITAQSQAGTATQFATDVLKKALGIEATDGAQLAQMLSQGSGVDIYA